MIYAFADLLKGLNENQGLLAAVAIIEAAILAFIGDKTLVKKTIIKNRDAINSSAPFIKAGTGIQAGGSITVGDVHNHGNAIPTQKQIAREVVGYLEDKRVLYNASQLENPAHCITAVEQIRGFLTRTIKKLNDNDDLSGELREMRSAARKFTDKGQSLDRYFGHGAGFDQEFFSALGEMRGVFSVNLKNIATEYSLPVEDDLASILQPDDSD